MKFAKELEEGSVPEWRSRYFDYKQGKKKIKAVRQAWRNVNARSSRTPRQQAQRTPSHDGLATSATPIATSRVAAHHAEPSQDGRSTRVGSIVGSPASNASTPSRPASLNLGDPAMDLSRQNTIIEHHVPDAEAQAGDSPSKPRPTHTRTHSSNAYEVGKTKHPSPFNQTLRRALSTPPRKTDGTPSSVSPFYQRILRRYPSSKLSKSPHDIPLEVQREVESKDDEFWAFLDSELAKIEAFYQQKEEESMNRLEELKRQLHQLRDQRLRELSKMEERRERKQSLHPEQSRGRKSTEEPPDHPETPEEHSRRLRSSIHSTLHAARHVHFHSSKASSDGKKTADLMTPQVQPRTLPQSDHERRPLPSHVKYEDAKRKLRAALREYYRGLEFLKSYVALNTTAFKKINKKYDKAIGRRRMAFMPKVHEAHFARSDLPDSHLHQVEDLYARYFEKGNRKVANAKLRKKGNNERTYHRSAFWDGLALALGLVFGLQGLVYAVQILFSEASNDRHVQTSYLLQLYAGYLLMLMLMMLFCVVCAAFDASKVNYAFIFEFDSRHTLNYRQLAEIPSLLLVLLGFIMWLNFSEFGGDTMYTYYPVVLIVATILVLGFPAPVLYHHSRIWIWETFIRVIFGSGFLTVRFGDLILGDMFNSLTYSVGNVELFFCLYAKQWNDPDQCNSSHSRLFGFFQTLPGIWRLLQCFHRYWGSRQAWPHLANAGKYTCTILQYMLLSIWRIDKNNTNLALFIVFAFLNTMYTWIWDVMMDWSLFTSGKKHRFLRNVLAFSPSYYYCAIFADFLLRSSWIFYVIFKDDSQHSSIVSFGIAFFEVFRRAMWTAFRVENDHVFNVLANKAVRNLGLPYDVPDSMDHVPRSTTTSDGLDPTTSNTGTSTPSDLENANGGIASTSSFSRPPGSTTRSPTLRRRQTTTGTGGPSPSIRSRVGDLMSSAHAQDFERRTDGPNEAEADEDDEDDEDDAEAELEEDEGELEVYESRANRSARGQSSV